jgi:hypothetical protein
VGSILSFWQGDEFDAEAIQAMGKAFEAACKDLNGHGQPDLVREIIAKRILEAAKKGERDPNRLHAKALDALGITPRRI